MSEDAIPPQLREYLLTSGYIYVPLAPTLISTVLGSCVAVTLWDRKRQYCGMNHFLYPSAEDPRQATARFGNAATAALIRMFMEEGSRKEDIEAQIFGGACAPDCVASSRKVSQQNIAVARSVLRKSRILIVSEDVGGQRGRKLVFNSLTGEVVIIRVERIRESDWHPYEGRRS